MIMMVLKGSVAFILSFIILSFQVNQKPIFIYMTELLGPLGTEIQQSFSKSVKRGFKKSSKIGKDLFENADPGIIDTISSERSSGAANRAKEMILEEIKKEEKRKLDEMINKE